MFLIMNPQTMLYWTGVHGTACQNKNKAHTEYSIDENYPLCMTKLAVESSKQQKQKIQKNMYKKTERTKKKIIYY
jgi:hypothetical protein